MSELREAIGLLEIASKTLIERILPQVESRTRYEALMIARALGIASRLAELGKHADLEELRDIESLLEAAPHGHGDKPPLGDLRRALCMEIRSGRFDARGPGRAALLRHLAAATKQRLAIDNPKLLERP